MADKYREIESLADEMKRLRYERCLKKGREARETKRRAASRQAAARSKDPGPRDVFIISGKVYESIGSEDSTWVPDAGPSEQAVASSASTASAPRDDAKTASEEGSGCAKYSHWIVSV
mmetsp:Transcript_14732/g.40661  ORF Transcript_14732/g.40661 Transcript_14732/m.40661 type:complete len:118 (-) Transcript_14732:132-485(-)